jgi:hypothetical protein
MIFTDVLEMLPASIIRGVMIALMMEVASTTGTR